MSKANQRRTIELRAIAHARSGDKGGNVNIGLIALAPEFYSILCRHVTADRVKVHFQSVCRGNVDRFELANIGALNFLLHDALDGGGTVSLRTDAQGKTYGAALLRLKIDLDPEESKLVSGSPVSP
jgi:hypothetical protein